MTGSSTAVARRVLSGLIVLAMLLLPGASHGAMPSGHAQGHCASQLMLSASGQPHSIGTSHADYGMTAEACCLGSSCIASATDPAPHHVVRIAWSFVDYWIVDSDATGIRPSPDLGPPITLG